MPEYFFVDILAAAERAILRDADDGPAAVFGDIESVGAGCD